MDKRDAPNMGLKPMTIREPHALPNELARLFLIKNKRSQGITNS